VTLIKSGTPTSILVKPGDCLLTITVSSFSCIFAWFIIPDSQLPNALKHVQNRTICYTRQSKNCLHFATSCGAKAQQTPSPCCTSRGFLDLTKNVIRSSQGHSTPSQKFHANQSSRFLVILLTKKQRYKQESCAIAKTTAQ